MICSTQYWYMHVRFDKATHDHADRLNKKHRTVEGCSQKFSEIPRTTNNPTDSTFLRRKTAYSAALCLTSQEFLTFLSFVVDCRCPSIPDLPTPRQFDCERQQLLHSIHRGPPGHHWQTAFGVPNLHFDFQQLEQLCPNFFGQCP